jgi:CBS domain-containing membrane protein
MATSPVIDELPVLFLEGRTAHNLMTPNIVSICQAAPLAEAVSLLMEKNLHAVPVMDKTGNAVGVLSRSDIVAHDAQRYRQLVEGKVDGDIKLAQGALQPSDEDEVLVGDIMTRVIYSVTPKTPAKSVVDAMLALGIHRLFVADEQDRLVGVISSIDILRQLHEPTTVSFEAVERLEVRRVSS